MRINVAYACDDFYIKYTGISMISLFENNINIEEICVYFIDMGVQDENINKIKDIVEKYNREIVIISWEKWKKDLKVRSLGRHIESVYAKIFFGRIPEIDKIIYMDSDTIIVDELETMWNTDLEDNWIAGVETISSIERNRKIGIKKEDVYINDGIVLMDLKKWRQNDVEKKCQMFIEKWNGNPPVLSEGTISAVCCGHIKKLHPKYNLMSGLCYYSHSEIVRFTSREYYTESVLNEAKNNPCIIHYLTAFYLRPWQKKCTHPLREYYRIYQQKSVWADDELEDKELPIKLKLIDYLHKVLNEEMFYLCLKIFGRKK